jgi:hypothetical protein
MSRDMELHHKHKAENKELRATGKGKDHRPRSKCLPLPGERIP